MQFQLHNQDALKFLTSLSSESTDLIITDPPYESLEKYRAIGTTTRLKKSKASSNEWFKIFPNSKFKILLSELFRVLRKNKHLYIFCDKETMFQLVPIAEEAGFKFWKPLIWDKVSIGMGYHYRCRYEFILFFEKGKRKLNNLSVPDILEHKRIRNGYPTEKPVSLLEVLINQSSDELDVVLDPFMGSCSTGVAAIKNNRSFVGIDIATKACCLGQRRLEHLRNIKKVI